MPKVNIELQTRIEKLEEKLRLARKTAAKEASAKRARDQAASRENELRKRMLAGTFILEGATNPIALVNAVGQSLGQWLVKAEDRALFGLAEPTPETTQTADFGQ